MTGTVCVWVQQHYTFTVRLFGWVREWQLQKCVFWFPYLFLSVRLHVTTPEMLKKFLWNIKFDLCKIPLFFSNLFKNLTSRSVIFHEHLHEFAAPWSWNANCSAKQTLRTVVTSITGFPQLVGSHSPPQEVKVTQGQKPVHYCSKSQQTPYKKKTDQTGHKRSKTENNNRPQRNSQDTPTPGKIKTKRPNY
jgi:hypothetical protein